MRLNCVEQKFGCRTIFFCLHTSSFESAHNNKSKDIKPCSPVVRLTKHLDPYMIFDPFLSRLSTSVFTERGVNVVGEFKDKVILEKYPGMSHEKELQLYPYMQNRKCNYSPQRQSKIAYSAKRFGQIFYCIFHPLFLV